MLFDFSCFLHWKKNHQAENFDLINKNIAQGIINYFRAEKCPTKKWIWNLKYKGRPRARPTIVQHQILTHKLIWYFMMLADGRPILSRFRICPLESMT